jgi:hypothetical protein
MFPDCNSAATALRWARAPQTIQPHPQPMARTSTMNVESLTRRHGRREFVAGTCRILSPGRARTTAGMHAIHTFSNPGIIADLSDRSQVPAEGEAESLAARRLDAIGPSFTSVTGEITPIRVRDVGERPAGRSCRLVTGHPQPGKAPEACREVFELALCLE